MRKILTLAVLAAGLNLVSFGQTTLDPDRTNRDKHRHGRQASSKENQSPEQIAKLRTIRLDKELKFTDTQREKVYSLQLDQAKRQKAYKQEMKKLHEARRAEQKSDMSKLHQLLTPEQQKLARERFTHRKGEKFMRKKREFRKGGSMDNQKSPEGKLEG